MLHVPCLDEQLHQRGMVIGHVLVADDAPNIPLVRLAHKNVTGCLLDRAMGFVETILFDQDTEVAKGLNKIIIGD